MTATATSPSVGDMQASSFTATVHPGARVVLSGELDVAGLDALRAALDQALLEPGELVRIDSAGLSFIDSMAVSELLQYQLAATARRRRICLEEVSGPVLQVLDLLDLRHVLLLPDEPKTSRSE